MNADPDHMHTLNKQLTSLGAKVHMLYEQEPGRMQVTIAASLCIRWSIYFYPPPSTHTSCHSTGSTGFIAESLITLPIADCLCWKSAWLHWGGKTGMSGKLPKAKSLIYFLKMYVKVQMRESVPPLKKTMSLWSNMKPTVNCSGGYKKKKDLKIL